MDKELRKKLNAYFEGPGLVDCAGPTNLREIGAAEAALGVKFSDNYKEFLTLYGGAALGAYLIYGLRFQDDMDSNLWSVVQNTNHYRSQGWPGIEDWYVVSDDGRGNPIGCKPDGSVWLSDHDAGFEQVKLADSFDDFLYKLLTDTLYEE